MFASDGKLRRSIITRHACPSMSPDVACASSTTASSSHGVAETASEILTCPPVTSSSDQCTNSSSSHSAQSRPLDMSQDIDDCKSAMLPVRQSCTNATNLRSTISPSSHGAHSKFQDASQDDTESGKNAMPPVRPSCANATHSPSTKRELCPSEKSELMTAATSAAALMAVKQEYDAGCDDEPQESARSSSLGSTLKNSESNAQQPSKPFNFSISNILRSDRCSVASKKTGGKQHVSKRIPIGTEKRTFSSGAEGAGPCAGVGRSTEVASQEPHAPVASAAPLAPVASVGREAVRLLAAPGGLLAAAAATVEGQVRCAAAYPWFYRPAQFAAPPMGWQFSYRE